MTNKTKTIDVDLVRELAAVLAEADLTEIEIESEDLHVRLSKRPAKVTTYATMPETRMSGATAASAEAKVPVAADESDADTAKNAVTSPMVGTAYLKPDPDAKPFVEPGQKVREGQTLLIVEAMKTFNPITSPRAGTVTAILVEDGQPVEFGEPLAVVE